MNGTVVKRLEPGRPGTKKYLAWLGNLARWAFAVRRRYDESKRCTFATVEIVIPWSFKFHDRKSVQTYNGAMSNNGQSA